MSLSSCIWGAGKASREPRIAAFSGEYASGPKELIPGACAREVVGVIVIALTDCTYMSGRYQANMMQKSRLFPAYSHLLKYGPHQLMLRVFKTLHQLEMIDRWTAN